MGTHGRLTGPRLTSPQAASRIRSATGPVGSGDAGELLGAAVDVEGGGGSVWAWSHIACGVQASRKIWWVPILRQTTCGSPGRCCCP